MQDLFKYMHQGASPQLISQQDIFFSLEDIHEKNPDFYEYINRNNIITSSEDFPFTIKTEFAGEKLNIPSLYIFIDTRQNAIYKLFSNIEIEKKISDNYTERRPTNTLIGINGDGLTFEQFTILKVLECDKGSGLNFPVTPDLLIEKIQKIIDCRIVELGKTPDTEGENNLIAILAFNKRITRNPYTSDLDKIVTEFLPSNHTDSIGSINKIANIAMQNPLMKSAIHKFRLSIITYFQEFLIEYTDLTNYLTENEIYNLQSLYINKIDIQIIMGKIEQCIKESKFDLSELDICYRDLFLLYDELFDSSWAENENTEKYNSFIDLIFNLYYICSLFKTNELFQKMKLPSNEIRKLNDKFSYAVMEFEPSLFIGLRTALGTPDISPLYEHYKYLLEERKSITINCNKHDIQQGNTQLLTVEIQKTSIQASNKMAIFSEDTSSTIDKGKKFKQDDVESDKTLLSLSGFF